MKEVSDVLEAIAERLAPATVEDFVVYAGLRDALAASPKAPGEDLASAIEVLLECETWRDRTHGLDRSYRRWRADLQGVAASPEPEPPPPPRAPRR